MTIFSSPGETIHCTANATVYEKLNVTSVQLRFMGFAHVEFPVGEHKTYETKLYFRDYQTVFGSKEEGLCVFKTRQLFKF